MELLQHNGSRRSLEYMEPESKSSKNGWIPSQHMKTAQHHHDITFVPSTQDFSDGEDLNRYDQVPLLEQMIYVGAVEESYMKAMQRSRDRTMRNRRPQLVGRGKVDAESVRTRATTSNRSVASF